MLGPGCLSPTPALAQVCWYAGGSEVGRRNPLPLCSFLLPGLCSPLREDEMGGGGEEAQVLSRGEVGL